MGVYTMAVKNLKESTKRGITILIALIIGAVGGTWIGWYQATGEYPLYAQKQMQFILPPDSNTAEQTFEDVSAFIQEDITDGKEYKEGYNCVDFALEVARNAHWKGLGAEIVGLTFEGNENIEHALLMFYTTDKGWQFYDPQIDRLTNLEIGQIYGGKRIAQIELLRLSWIPLEQAFEEANSGNSSGN